VLVTTPESPICLDKANVIVPHTGRLFPEVTEALEAIYVGAQLVDVSGSDTAYFELLRELWAKGESFCLVEHDIVVTPGTISSMNDCGHEWCASKYSYLRGSYWGLGCTRFRGPLLKRFPDLMDEVGEYDSPGHGRGHWCSLDQALTASLRARRIEWPHIHGEVIHLGGGQPSHGCR
jgi:hypothetical protein